MPYRTPVKPNPLMETTEEWLQWLQDDGRVIPIVGTNSPTCEICRGAVTENSFGEPWQRCYQCSYEQRVLDYLSGVVSVTYSTADTFEPLIYYFKDRDWMWLSLPLGSLLYEFLSTHSAHIEHTFGTIDVWTVVPSHEGTRGGWDHMKALLEVVPDIDDLGPWERDLLTKTRPERVDRHVEEDLYRANRNLDGEHVLLIDDTYTTGATICSAAAALRAAGAADVVGLTLGRQLNPEWGSAPQILGEHDGTNFDYTTCVLE